MGRNSWGPVLRGTECRGARAGQGPADSARPRLGVQRTAGSLQQGGLVTMMMTVAIFVINMADTGVRSVLCALLPQSYEGDTADPQQKDDFIRAQWLTPIIPAVQASPGKTVSDTPSQPTSWMCSACLWSLRSWDK
jgi:hypothetical protein